MNSIEQVPFDWDLVEKLNPEVIDGQGEIRLVRSFVRMILNTDFQGLPQSFYMTRDFPKLLILFQATAKRLYASQKHSQNTCNEQKKKIKEAAEEITKLKQTENNLRKLLHSEQPQGESCPLCKKRFKTLEYIDKHIKNKHAERLAAWEFVRGFTDSIQTEKNNTNSDNSENNSKQPKREIELKFVRCNSITIESSMSIKKQIERRVFELDEEEVQPNNDDNFIYMKNQVPPIQKDLTKLPHQNNGFNNTGQNSSNIKINQIGISNNDQIAKSQMDMVTNVATSNIINGYNEIVESHKKYYSTPQTPKENISNYDKKSGKHVQLNSPLANPNYPKSKTPDQGKRTTMVMTPQDEEAQVQRKERQHHHHHHDQTQQQQLQQQQQQQIQQLQQLQQQQQQQIQQLQQLQQMQQIHHENRPQTPPATSCRKQQGEDEHIDRPSTTGSVTPNAQKHQRHQQQQQKYQQQQQQQIQQQQKYQQQQQQQIQQQQIQQKIQQQQKYQQQQQQQDNQKQVLQQNQESQLHNDESDPFILENDDENESTTTPPATKITKITTKPSKNDNDTKHIEFTTAQLDDLIQRSDNEEPEEEAGTRPQTPKKRRKKRRVIQVSESIIQASNDATNNNSTTTTNQSNPQEIKFNFKGTKNNQSQNDNQEIDDTPNESQKLKTRKPSVTFINTDENYDETTPSVQQQQNRKKEVTIGIKSRVDAKTFNEEDGEKKPEIKISKKETKTVKRMGGYDITNSELENLIVASSQTDEYDQYD